MDAVTNQNQSSSMNAWNSASTQKPLYFKISGYVQQILNDDKTFYIGCPDCKRKVQPDPIGYRCEQCSKVFEKANPTYMLSAKIADNSGNTFVTFPKELGDEIMGGLSAVDFKNLKEDSSPEHLKNFV